MTVDLADYEQRARAAIQGFWAARRTARQQQVESGKGDQGERAGVTAGKNMDGFIDLCRKLVRERLYSAASVLMSARAASADGKYAELSELTGMKTLVTEFAGHMAAEKARTLL